MAVAVEEGARLFTLALVVRALRRGCSWHLLPNHILHEVGHLKVLGLIELLDDDLELGLLN